MNSLQVSSGNETSGAIGSAPDLHRICTSGAIGSAPPPPSFPPPLPSRAWPEGMAEDAGSAVTGMDGSSAEGGGAPLELHGRLSVAREVKWWPAASRNRRTCCDAGQGAKSIKLPEICFKCYRMRRGRETDRDVLKGSPYPEDFKQVQSTRRCESHTSHPAWKKGFEAPTCRSESACTSLNQQAPEASLVSTTWQLLAAWKQAWRGVSPFGVCVGGARSRTSWRTRKWKLAQTYTAVRTHYSRDRD